MEIHALSPEVKSKQEEKSALLRVLRGVRPRAMAGNAGPAGGSFAGPAPGRQTQPLPSTARAQESVAMQTNGIGYDFLSINWEKMVDFKCAKLGMMWGKGLL